MTGDAMAQLIPALRRAGLQVASGSEKDLVIVLPDRRSRYVDLKLHNRRLGRSNIVHSADRPTMYAAVSATSAVVSAAKDGEFDLVTFDPPRVIVAAQAFIQPGASQRNVLGRPGWGTQAVLRILATTALPLRQVELAEMVGISPQAVSQVLKRAGDRVVRDGSGWTAREGVLRTWVEEYRGPGGMSTYWYGLDDPAEQSRLALALLDELDLTGIIGGDLAADRYSPWQLPGSVRLYLPELIDFTSVGFSPAQPAEATMTVVVPLDPTIVHVATTQARPYVGRHLLADPAITMWDLLNTSGTPTAHEAAHHLNTAISARSLDA
ncbi:hypothetical protein ACFWUP_10405 [Nocardia sp. NPDC058658]|uniref:hypothetical protein n=1 Tax=Nocardia sp. NPDC058658 TaxID=3346580 RepID=UPI0036698E78